MKEEAARELPHRITDSTLEALSGDAGRELLHALVGDGTLPADVERRILEPAEGNPFFLEELIRSLVDAGRGGARRGRAGGSSTTSPLEVPPTVEKVILARIDRLDAGARATRWWPRRCSGGSSACHCSRRWSAARKVPCGSRCST